MIERWERSIELARSYVEEGKYDEALAMYGEMLEKSGVRCWMPLCWRGMVYLMTQRFEEALADFNEAIELYPDQCAGYYLRGELMFDRGRLEEALADFTRVIELDPTKEAAWGSRASCLASMGRLDEACEAFQEAASKVTLDETRNMVFREGGAVLCRLGRYAEALEMLDEALRLSPDDAEALLWHAEALFRLGRTFEAKNEVERYMELVPEHAMRAQRFIPLFKEIASASLSQGIEELSRIIREGAFKEDGEEVACRLQRATFFYKLGRPEEALQDLDHVLRLDPRCVEAFVLRGDVYSFLREYGKAYADYDRAIELNPDHPFLYAVRGRTLMRMGEWDKGKEDVEKALRMDSATPWCYESLAFYAWVVEKDRRKALALLEKGFRIGETSWGSLLDPERDGRFLEGLRETPEFLELVRTYIAGPPGGQKRG